MSANYESLLQHRLIAVAEIGSSDAAPRFVAEIGSSDAAPRFAEALLKDGISIVEITMRTKAGAVVIAVICQGYPEMRVGAGTVLTLDDSTRMRDAVACFGVAPRLNAIVESLLAEDWPFLSGIATATEIEHDCRMLKCFLAESTGGASYLRTMSEPYAHRDVHFCATGGVTLDNLETCFACLGVSAVEGSWIASQAQTAANDWSGITSDCLRAIDRTLQMTKPK